MFLFLHQFWSVPNPVPGCSRGGSRAMRRCHAKSKRSHTDAEGYFFAFMRDISMMIQLSNLMKFQNSIQTVFEPMHFRTVCPVFPTAPRTHTANRLACTHTARGTWTVERIWTGYDDSLSEKGSPLVGAVPGGCRGCLRQQTSC